MWIGRIRGRACIAAGLADGAVTVRDDGTQTSAVQATGAESVVVTRVSGGRHVVWTSHRSGVIRRWDVSTGGQFGPPLPVSSSAPALATAELHGRPVVVSAGYHHGGQCWDAETAEPVGAPFAKDMGRTDLATGRLGEMTVAVTGHKIKIICWDPTTASQAGSSISGFLDSTPSDAP
ncbi:MULTISPECIES: hypothetical protein [unclassified Frankia]|uniref:hypothetical protein n=1 Tax=unclassified Frankia TaxID=2632575 RepID=UPI0020248D5D